MISRRCAAAALYGLLSASVAAAAELRGRVFENEKKDGLEVAEAELRADGANPTASDSEGDFHFVLPRRQPGDDIRLTVRKDGYEVVNNIQLEKISLPSRPADQRFTVLLCKPQLCEEMRRRFYRLKGIETVEASYRQKLRELEQRNQAAAAEVAHLKRERNEALEVAKRAAEDSETYRKGIDTVEASYQQKLRELEQRNQAAAAEVARLKRERDTALEAAGRDAVDLARARPAEGSETYRKALRLFLDGEAVAALEVLDEAKLRSSLEAARSQTAEGERKIAEVAESYVLRGKLLALQLRFSEAEAGLRQAVAAAPQSFDAHYALAWFLATQNRHAEAAAALRSCLQLARARGSEADVAIVSNDLGYVLARQGRLDEARGSYDEALALYRALAAKDPAAHLDEVAKTQGNIAMLLRRWKRPDEARKILEELLVTFRALAKANPEVHLPDLALALGNLGVLLNELGRPGEARALQAEALATYRRLAEGEPAYRAELARTLNSLGVLLSEQGDFGEARKALDEAHSIRERLAAENPDKHQPDLASTLHNQGYLLHREGRLAEARAAYEAALVIRRRLAETDPDGYRPNLASTLNDLANVLADEGRLDGARKAFEEALAIYRRLAAIYPDAYAAKVAATESSLATLALLEAEARQRH